MKRLLLPALLSAALLLLQPHARACNYSSFTLVSFTAGPGPVYTIVTQLCIGYGRTGVAFGANGTTNSLFSLTMYSTAHSPAAMQAALTGWTLNLQMGTAQNGIGIPPGPVAFSADPALGPYYGQVGVGWGLAHEVDNLFYADPVCYCMDYACISTTADCGNAGSHCQTITLNYSGIYPDSIRALGIEGTPPFDGCWPNSDMMITLTNLPVVWGTVEGHETGEGVSLNWETLQELGEGEFVVERASGPGGAFAEVGRLASRGGDGTPHQYNFTDRNEQPGESQYRIIRYGANGSLDHSEIISVHVNGTGGLQIGGLWPQPSRDQVWLTLESAEAGRAEWQLWDVKGQILCSGHWEVQAGRNETLLQLEGLPAGMLDLRILTAKGQARKRVLKL